MDKITDIDYKPLENKKQYSEAKRCFEYFKEQIKYYEKKHKDTKDYAIFLKMLRHARNIIERKIQDYEEKERGYLEYVEKYYEK